MIRRLVRQKGENERQLLVARKGRLSIAARIVEHMRLDPTAPSRRQMKGVLDIPQGDRLWAVQTSRAWTSEPDKHRHLQVPPIGSGAGLRRAPAVC
jgi:hypothetical protein